MGLGLRARDRLSVKLGTKESLAKDVLDNRATQSGPPPGPTLVSIADSPSPGVQYEV